MKGFFPAFCFFIIVSFFPGCKSPPPREESAPNPGAFLVFTGVEADNPVNLDLKFTLNLNAPASRGAKLESWQAEINGEKPGGGFSLEEKGFFSLHASGESTASFVPSSFELKLCMDVDALASQGLAPTDDYRINLILGLDFQYDEISNTPVRIEVSGLAAFPGVRAPEFSITNIAILKDELVNTMFRVGLKINNPNPFPVDLASFRYVLHGHGMHWADGAERNIIQVEKKSTLRGNLFLDMNFIEMKRDLLNQIIRLEDVNYRFSGEAQIITGVEYLPKFKSGFDLSGYSPVLDE
jgi:LEA14-like dessication related protein